MEQPVQIPSFTIHTPRDIVFGPGAASKLASYLPPGARRVLIVAGRHAAETDAKAIAGDLTAAGREVRVFADTMAEPSPGAVDKAANA
ncbi:MAG: iron-containing alcohol dehydrogenase, partial [Lentisphaeria bacterium]|nr:iron-containing alcohol dehydrogenase [Lentisphaeria bacterium]